MLLSGVELGPGGRELRKKRTKQKQAIFNYLLMELTGETIQPKIPIFIFGNFQWQMAVSRISGKEDRLTSIIKLKMRVLSRCEYKVVELVLVISLNSFARTESLCTFTVSLRSSVISISWIRQSNLLSSDYSNFTYTYTGSPHIHL